MASTRWLNFFRDAGIPSGPASEYAVIFTDNRMRMDMLNELHKEILQDLGIKVMGDILAILRHSKKVYAQISRSAAEEFDVNRTKSPEQNKITPTSKLYSDAIENITAIPEQKHETVSRKKTSAEAKEPTILKAMSKPAAEKLRIQPDIARKVNKPAGRSLSERFTEYNPVPSKKKKNDLNEVLTISVPVETENSSEKIPNKIKKMAQDKDSMQDEIAKKTVFDRLGASSNRPEITKQDDTSSMPLQIITRKTSAPSISTAKEMKTGMSVFKRLGDSVTQLETTKLRSERIDLHSNKSQPSSTSAVTVTYDKQHPMMLGLHGSNSVLRPVKSVKPIPRKPLAMDLEKPVQTKTLKPVSKQKNIAKQNVHLQQERKTGSKSVFDRLGK